MRRTRPEHYLLLMLLLGGLGALLLYPIWLTVRGGFATNVVTGEGFTLQHLLLVFEDPALRAGVVNALLIAVATTTLSALIGVPLGVLSARHTYPFKRLWDAAILVPLILPPFVGAIGFKAILGRTGALNALLGTEMDILGTARFWGVVVALALHLYPIIYLNVTASCVNIDPAMDEAARIAGAGPVRRFFSITLPMLRPGLFAGSSIVLIWSFTELGTPLVFDYYTVSSVQIFHGIKEMNVSAQPYALTVVLLFIAIMMYLLGKYALGREQATSTTRAFRGAEEMPLRGAAGWLVGALFALVTLFALLPHVGVVVMALARPESWYQTLLPAALTLENFEAALQHPLVFGSIRNSLMLSIAAALLNMGLGVAIGYIIVRTTVRGRHALDSLAMLPLAVPGLVMAFGYVAMSLRWPFSKGAPLEGAVDVVGSTPNPIPLLIVAYAVRRLPYIVRATVAGLQQVSVEVEEAATVFGASTMTKVRRIIVPMIAGNLIAGGLLVFAFSMLEVSDSLILAQQERHYPITKAIYTLTERLGDGTVLACALGVWAMLLLAVSLAAVSSLLGRRFGAIFRV